MHDQQELTQAGTPEAVDTDGAAAEFEELIQGRCKQPFQARVQKILDGRLRTHCCGLDSPQTFVILPDGHLTKCEHMIEGGFVGDIYKGVTDTARIEQFKERIDDRAMCAGCPVLPDCVQLRH